MKITKKLVNPWEFEKTDQYYGFEDAKDGFYNKYYRYNSKDQGKAYDEGVKAAIKQGAVIEHYLEEMPQVHIDVDDNEETEDFVDKIIWESDKFDFINFLNDYDEDNYLESKQYADNILYDFLYDEKNQRQYLKEDLDNDEQVVQYMTDKYLLKDDKFTNYVIDQWKLHYLENPKYRKYIKRKYSDVTFDDSKKKLMIKEDK